MSVKLKLQPFSAPISQTKSVSFSVTGLDKSKKYRISFENATMNRNATVSSVSEGNAVGDKVFLENQEAISGKLDLAMYDADSVGVVSIYANVDEKTENDVWKLSDIAAFTFQIENPNVRTSSDRITVYPPFVTSDQRATIRVKTNPNSDLQVVVNNKRFIVKSDFQGEGSISFRAIDILSGSESSAKAVQKYPVYYSLPVDKYKESYDSGSFIHFIPENLKALQATNSPSSPSCAIIDRSPGPGLTIQSLDDFCMAGPVVGPYSIFDKTSTDSTYYNSQVGFCSSLEKVYPLANEDSVCRIYNSTSSALLHDGSALVAFASQQTYASDPYSVPSLSSRIFIANLPTSLKYKGNPVRDGSILKPAKFYHSVTPSSLTAGETYGIVFRVLDGTFFEIQFSTIDDTVAGFTSSFAHLINTNEKAIQYGIRAIDQESFLEVVSEERFSIQSRIVSGAGSLEIKLNSNTTIALLTTTDAILDEGNTVIFLFNPLGYQAHTIVSRDVSNNLIYLNVSDGFNNDIGPTILDNIYCQSFVIVNTDEVASGANLSEISPLPPILDSFGRETPCVYPSICSRTDLATGKTYVYVVCQSPVDGIYQLFYYSFIVGETPTNTQWKQLTDFHENKNAKIRCDNSGNIHFVWESDRSGITQVYYSVLGSSSNILANQVLMSAIDKHAVSGNSEQILVPFAPIAIQDTWNRFLYGNGEASVVSSSEVAVAGNPVDDAAMAVFSLSKDEFGEAIPDYFNQLSYQISFDLSITGIPEDILDEQGIQEKFNLWASEFTPVGDHKYKKDGNIFTMDSYSPYFSTVIPICGSYEFPYELVHSVVGGNVVSGYSNTKNTFSTLNEEASLSTPSNIKHFMLGLMPEKIKFRAKNTEAFSQYCERIGVSSSECDGFVNDVEHIVSTGRFKLCLIISTTENQSTGEVARKKFIISRVFGDYIDFRSSKNIKIAVHYSKANSEYISSLLKRDRQAVADANRFQGDISVLVDNEAKIGETFMADFSDGYNKFDIGLGMPFGGVFEINEALPYKGNSYESVQITQLFSNIAIGPHTVNVNRTYAAVSANNRNTRQMVVPDRFVSSILNGSFENSTTPRQKINYLDYDETSITGWKADSPVTYYYIPRAEQTGISKTLNGSAWVALSGYSDQDSSNPVQFGKLSQTIQTSIGKRYFVFFDISSEPSDDELAENIIRKVKASAGSTTNTFSITSTTPSRNNWATRSFSFVASGSTTTVSFENVSDSSGSQSLDALYPPHLDNIIVVAEDQLSDQTHSISVAQNLMVDQEEYALNYSLNATNIFTQLPVTISSSDQNKYPDIFVDNVDKIHIAWQSNRNGYWDIYYTGSRDRRNPFKFETRISASKSNSTNPTIAVDNKGRRVIAWQDNRNGNNQIFAAMSKVEDEMLLNRCKQDEVDTFLYEFNTTIDPYFDFASSQLNCEIEFEVLTTISTLYHFSLSFYEDKEYTKLYKTISSENTIDGWFVDGVQLTYNGLSAQSGTTYTVKYTPSSEDDLSGRVLYVIAEYQINSNPINLAHSTNIQIVQPYSGLDLRPLRFQADNTVRAILEFEGSSPAKIKSQTVSSLQETASDTILNPFTDITFEGGLESLPGAAKGDKVKSILLHFDPVAISQTVTAVVTFTSPIAAIFVSAQTIVNSMVVFGFPGVEYPQTTGIGLEGGDSVSISEDRKTLTLICHVYTSVSQMRVILENDAKQVGKNEFAYYCSTEQSSRCNIDCVYINNNNVDKNIHFRATFFADPLRTVPVVSAFTKLDNLGWQIGDATFPVGGLRVEPGQKISAIYQPEIMPFELRESQNQVDISQIIRQPIMCGVTYFVTIESLVDDLFVVESQFEFICPCAKTEADFWRTDKDSINWICSGQGFDDFRISKTDNQCLMPKICVTDFDTFHIVWQDYRFTRMLANQPALSPDYFVAFYDASADEFFCSGQGGYDRRITTYDPAASRVLYDASILIDQFQNLNIVMHDGRSVFTKSCSFGCNYVSTPASTTKPCMFTDNSDSSLFFMGGEPDRDVDQYQKVRIEEKYIVFSTYVDLQTPMVVVNDCFVELDILGVPGTLAYRLKNENDQDWSEWLPIGADVPTQPGDDSDSLIEKNFFRAYFTQKNRFVAPWIISPGDGLKRVCCEILSFSGKSDSFCVDFMAIYENLEYKVNLYFDEAFTKPVPEFKSYMVVSNNKTETPIDDSNLISIQEPVTAVNSIYARIEFKDKKKIQLVEKIQNISRFGLSDKITMSVYQQGTNDQVDIPLTKISDGLYKGQFTVNKDDGIVNADGLAAIIVNVPGQCKPITYKDISDRVNNILLKRSIDQKTSVFNNFTIFRDRYIGDDIKGSFGSPEYYKIRTFGIGGSSAGDFGNSEWIGGGNSPLNNDTGYILPPDPPK